MLLPLLYFEATEAVLLYLVSGVALKVETSRWLSSGKLVAPKEDNIQILDHPKIFECFSDCFLFFRRTLGLSGILGLRQIIVLTNPNPTFSLNL